MNNKKNKFVFVILISLVCLSSFEAMASFRLLTVNQYKKLSSSDKIWYSNHVRMAWLEFEKSYSYLEKSSHKKGATWSANFFSSASANADSTACVICGVRLMTVKNSEGNMVCPTRGRPCSKFSDGFQCGPLFGNACIEREPVSTLSYRGYMDKSSSSLSESDYKAAKIEMENSYNELCQGAASDGCKYLNSKIAELNTSPILTEPTSLANKMAAAAMAMKKTQETSVTSSSVPSNARVATIAAATPAVASAECKGDTDPVTRRELVVSRFSFAADRACHFENNKRILEDLARNGCQTGGTRQTDKLFTTNLKIKNLETRADGSKGYSFILGETSSIDGIVEGIKGESINGQTGYKIQMLMPSIQEDGGKFSRVFLSVVEVGGKYYLVRPDGSKSEEIQITNSVRRNIMIENVSATQRALDRMFAGRIALAQDCVLAEKVKSLSPAVVTGEPAVVE